MLEDEDRPLATAARLFAELAEVTADPPGVSRDSYGKGEGLAHAMLVREAKRLGVEHKTDDIGNLYLTLPGRDRTAPVLMTGSHIDSVRHGGNYDGAAGVLAGLALLEWLSIRNVQPPFDVTVMAIRAEEMVWFPTHYLGSRAAFGLLPSDTADTLKRSDTGRSLAEHMSEHGFDPSAIHQARPQLEPTAIRSFIELHIEQGPVLRGQGLPAGIVTAIRGNVRYRFAKILGQTTHAGGVPKSYRKDAVLAGAELVAAMESWWQEIEDAGGDLVVTIGEFATNSAVHGITKVAGELNFTIDFRSIDPAIREEFDRRLHQFVTEIADRRGVAIELGPVTRADHSIMNKDLRQALVQAAARAETPFMELASGGGHDCAVFAWQGIPSAMIFVANDHGSHNPHEHMELADFAAAWRILAIYVEEAIRHV